MDALLRRCRTRCLQPVFGNYLKNRRLAFLLWLNPTEGECLMNWRTVPLRSLAYCHRVPCRCLLDCRLVLCPWRNLTGGEHASLWWLSTWASLWENCRIMCKKLFWIVCLKVWEWKTSGSTAFSKEDSGAIWLKKREENEDFSPQRTFQTIQNSF